MSETNGLTAWLGALETDMQIIDGNSIKEITPEIVAELFAGMDAGEQARFFNHVDAIASTWKPGHDLLPFQMQAITDDDGLTLAGRRVMQMIGDYSHWGIVCKIVNDTHA